MHLVNSYHNTENHEPTILSRWTRTDIVRICDATWSHNHQSPDNSARWCNVLGREASRIESVMFVTLASAIRHQLRSNIALLYGVSKNKPLFGSPSINRLAMEYLNQIVVSLPDLLVGLFCVWIIGGVLYRLQFSPLAKFPWSQASSSDALVRNIF